MIRERMIKADEDNRSKKRTGSGRGRFRSYISQCFAIRCSVAYYMVLVAGAIAFQRGLWLLTESDRLLARIG